MTCDVIWPTKCEQMSHLPLQGGRSKIWHIISQASFLLQWLCETCWDRVSMSLGPWETRVDRVPQPALVGHRMWERRTCGLVKPLRDRGPLIHQHNQAYPNSFSCASTTPSLLPKEPTLQLPDEPNHMEGWGKLDNVFCHLFQSWSSGYHSVQTHPLDLLEWILKGAQWKTIQTPAWVSHLGSASSLPPFQGGQLSQAWWWDAVQEHNNSEIKFGHEPEKARC